MNRPAGINNKSKYSVDSVFVLTVFALFVCTLLAGVLCFAGIYKRTGENTTERFSFATAHSIVLQKLHAYDKKGGIEVKNIEDTPVLCLYENIAGEEFVTYLYSDGNSLCELFIQKERPFDKSSSVPLFEAKEFDIVMEKNKVTFTFTIGNETSRPSVCYIKCYGEGDYYEE